MDVALDLISYANALGRAQAAWRFASPQLRRAAALATISKAWEIFLRDAGAGEVGLAHETTSASAQLMFTQDPRRDGVLLWLADHGAPPIAEAATTLACMVGAARRFSVVEQALLDAARDALTQPVGSGGSIGQLIARSAPGGDPVLAPLLALAAAIDRLRRVPGYLESKGAEVRHSLPRGVLSHYVQAEPAGCWAFNLALMGAGAHAAGVLPPPGLASRASFRSDFEPEEIACSLVDDVAVGWSGTYDRLLRLEPELTRGLGALAHLSRNARTRDAWMLVAALGACTRTQLARALGLSRAGADIQARTLADAGLTTLATGRISWARQRPNNAVPSSLDRGLLGDAVSDLDANLAEIDRLLARNAR